MIKIKDYGITDGVWKFEHYYWNEDGLENAWINLKSFDQIVIDAGFSWDEEGIMNIQEPDRLLIEAAPDLLEACLYVLENLCNYPEYRKEHFGIISEVWYAIKKAIPDFEYAPIHNVNLIKKEDEMIHPEDQSI